MDVRWVCGNDFGSKGTGLRVVGLEVAVNDIINDARQLLVIPFGQFDNGPLNPFRRFLDAGGTVVPGSLVVRSMALSARLDGSAT